MKIRASYWPSIDAMAAAPRVHDRMSERVRHLRTVSDPMRPYVPSEPMTLRISDVAACENADLPVVPGAILGNSHPFARP